MWPRREAGVSVEKQATAGGGDGSEGKARMVRTRSYTEKKNETTKNAKKMEKLYWKPLPKMMTRSRNKKVTKYVCFCLFF